MSSLEEILEEFDELDDRGEQAEFLVELGETLPPFPDPDRTEENRVLGCQSKVWMTAQAVGEPVRLDLKADSDAPMVRGLVALLLAAYSGKTPREIVDFPVEQAFERMKLGSLLSNMRSNGLFSMVKRIRTLGNSRLEDFNPAAAPAVPAGPPKIPLVTPRPTTRLDVARLRRDFPILDRTLDRGRKLIYLDNAASTQRPYAVLDAMADIERRSYSNVHRGGHALAAETTAAFERARESLRRFLNARSTNEIIFTSGTTAGINLVARAYGDANLKAGDEIVLTLMEHHSNIVPWQQLAARVGAVIRWVPFTERGEIDPADFAAALNERTKLVAVTALSNVFGTINPVGEMIQQVRAKTSAKVLIDGAQSVPHLSTDVQALDCDFLVFSGHKMAGPSGVGALYGKEELLQAMPPFLGGGSMIHRVTTEGFTPADLPHRFEAGTPPIIPAIGLGAAVEYLEKVGIDAIHAHEQTLAAYAHAQLTDIPDVRVLGPEPARKGGVATFVIKGVAAADLAWMLDGKGIAVRAGHHCAMPLHDRLGLEGSCRASFYLYNTSEEVDALAAAVRDAVRSIRKA